MVYSAHLTPSLVLRRDNSDHFVAILIHAQRHGLPWLAVGYWSVEPAAARCFLADVGGASGTAAPTVLAPARPTYASNGAGSTLY